MAFRKVESNQKLPEMEKEIISLWNENDIFQKTLDNRKDAKEYTFYDGPPFATGLPHYGHIVASVIKDVVPRYWTMRGYYVERKWGWDCHGLPIENIVEKEMGSKKKKDIEDMGVAAFNEKCRDKVLTYVTEWEKSIERLGRWADMKNAYRTMDKDYMESVWWVFKELWDKGLIYEDYRSMHICPRCETTLSQQEVSEGYKDIKDLSVIAKFELVDEPRTYVLAWTTTPWTLPGNVALAVGADIDYVKVRNNSSLVSEKVTRLNEDIKEETIYDEGFYILAKEIFWKNLTGNAGLSFVKRLVGDSSGVAEEIFESYKKSINEKGSTQKELAMDYFFSSFGKKYGIELISGRELVGKKYVPLFDAYSSDGKLENRENGWQIYAADFVTTDEGTGVVHIAPAFGEDDMQLGREKNLPFVQHVAMDGVFASELGELAGLNVKPIDDHQSTDIEIIKYLAKNGTLFHKEKYEHSYPHCWRCDTPLINYATSSWFVAVTKIKNELLENAKEITWSPAHMKEGRFGKWLEGARDWSISRQRFWASVMPIWVCGDCGEQKVFGSVAELEKMSGKKVDDLHKHIVDEVTFACEKCDGMMTRVPDVLDTWFDSGSMPYAQKHYPFENEKRFEQNFPADFIAEGVDQTRAWFYYQHVIATGIKRSRAFNNVIVNGIVLAEDGKKMSKKLQNYPDPGEMFEKYGADTVRYYLMQSPVVAAENVNFMESEVREVARGMMRMLWNSYSFFTLYANIDNFVPVKKYVPNDLNNILDKWIVSELHMLIKEFDVHMENYELHKAARTLPKFIDNLSNWYIRRSRKRFWKSENDGDKNEAYQTLHYVLVELSKVMAPFTPFIAEEICTNLTGEKSVHLADFPQSNASLIDKELNDEMQLVRDIISEGLKIRAKTQIKVRQPLEKLQVQSGKFNVSEEFLAVICEELNVKEVIVDDFDFVEDAKNMGEVNDMKIMVETEITQDLKLEGQSREIIRYIQQMRKKAGYEVDDRINVGIVGFGDVIAAHRDMITHETLADKLVSSVLDMSDLEEENVIDGEKIQISIKK
jgi:isoleucyl-tRNA synthetase